MKAQTKRKKGGKYDLTERTKKFSVNIISFLKTVPKTEITRPLISQLTRSDTSIGANYMEADCAQSKKDFVYKISLARKEAKETLYWLEIIGETNKSLEQQTKEFSKESLGLVKIFSLIISKTSETFDI